MTYDKKNNNTISKDEMDENRAFEAQSIFESEDMSRPQMTVLNENSDLEKASDKNTGSEKKEKEKILIGLCLFLALILTILAIFYVNIRQNFVNNMELAEELENNIPTVPESVAIGNDDSTIEKEIIKRIYEDGLYVDKVYNENNEFLYQMKYAIRVDDEDSEQTDDGQLYHENGYFYDEKTGNLIKYIDSEGVVTLYGYSDGLSNPTSTTIYDNDGSVEKEVWDGREHLLGSTKVYLDGSVRETIYDKDRTRYFNDYSENNDLIDVVYDYANGYLEEWVYFNGKLDYLFVFFCYNGKNISIPINEHLETKINKTVEDDGTILYTITNGLFKYTYEKKENGDWIKEVNDEKGKLVARTYYWKAERIFLSLSYDKSEKFENWYYFSGNKGKARNDSVSGLTYHVNASVELTDDKDSVLLHLRGIGENDSKEQIIEFTSDGTVTKSTYVNGSKTNEVIDDTDYYNGYYAYSDKDFYDNYYGSIDDIKFIKAIDESME